ncbi:carbon-nitrogen hydrolase family protein [Caldicellulosiruptor kronotskyensis]|nr:carbon-nitrogen hydrolase family protein [Caldicellulosiruptor kronotskyensis]
MKIGVVQMKISNSIENNLLKIANFLEQAKVEEIDLICFPEMALTGYNIELLKSMNLNDIILPALDKISQLASKYSVCCIIGHPFYEGKELKNCASIIFPDGRCEKYYKLHPTEIEKKIFSDGKNPLVFEYKQKRFGTAICRDQNFYNIFKEYKDRECDGVFILAAHYYSPKEARWKIDKNRSIPITRAVENGYYVFLANATGAHLNMISLGHSLIVDGSGCIICEADEAGEYLLTAEI